MSMEQWISVLSATVFLGIAALAALRARTTPLAPPLSRTCAALFAYELFEVLKHATGREEMLSLECAAAALVAPTTVALVVQFVGHWRRLRLMIILGATYFMGIAVVCILAVFVAPLRDFPGQWPWAIAMLVGVAPEFTVVTVLLVRHARRVDAKERARTQLFGLALLLGVGGASSDLASIAGAGSPRIAVFGLVSAAIILALLALRFSFLEGVTGLVAANVLVSASLVVFGNIVAASWLGGNAVLVVSLALTVAAVATLRPILAALSESRARARYHQTLGRFSAQMAHDLRNPLSAIRGAAQYLIEERRRGASIDEQGSFLELILEQAGRLERVVGEYQRLGRAEAVRSLVSMPELADQVRQAQVAAGKTPQIELQIDPGLESLSLDRDLIAGALENLVRNAREAGASKVVVGADRQGQQLRLWVEDDGPGMDERTSEQAFDEFFSTKSTSSGLGLAFVARVAEAHGGRARIVTRPSGLRVELQLVA